MAMLQLGATAAAATTNVLLATLDLGSVRPGWAGLVGICIGQAAGTLMGWLFEAPVPVPRLPGVLGNSENVKPTPNNSLQRRRGPGEVSKRSGAELSAQSIDSDKAAPKERHDIGGR